MRRASWLAGLTPAGPRRLPDLGSWPAWVPSSASSLSSEDVLVGSPRGRLVRRLVGPTPHCWWPGSFRSAGCALG